MPPTTAQRLTQYRAVCFPTSSRLSTEGGLRANGLWFQLTDGRAGGENWSKPSSFGGHNKMEQMSPNKYLKARLGPMVRTAL